MGNFEIRNEKIQHQVFENVSTISKLDKNKHELTIKTFESDPQSDILEEDYEKSKLWLDNWYEEYTKGVILRSKSDWYEQGEKSTKYFLNLEKHNSIKNTIRKIYIHDIESDDDEAILDHTKSFYENIFERKCDKTLAQCHDFLDKIATPTLSVANKYFYDKVLCEVLLVRDSQTQLFFI